MTEKRDNLRSNVIQWIIALALSVAFELPIALNRTHHVSHKESVHVFAAVVAILALTLVLRLLFFAVTWVWRRGKAGSGRSAPSST